MRRFALAAALLLRAADHATFAGWLLRRHPSWTEIFATGANFGLIDGVLALVVVARVIPLARHREARLLAMMTCLDAIGRLGVGVALKTYPGLPVFPMTVVPFFGIVGASAAILGMFAMTAWLIARVRAGRRWSLESDALFDPLAVTAIASFVVGYVLFADPPSNAAALRTLAVSASVVLAVVFTIAALGASMHRTEL